MPVLPLLLALLLAACGEGEPLTPPDARLPDGSRYRGELVNGLLQGEGRLDHPDGSWYRGGFLDGVRHGQGEWHGANGERYVGSFENGAFEGLGILEEADGTRYEGGFKVNRFHGQGLLRWPDGSTHQGRFENGQANGQGERSGPAGARYSGIYRNDALEGEGTFSGADGERYSGGFAQDSFDGEGRYQSAAGDVWQGRFRAGSAEGPGTFRGADGEHYQGSFRHWRYHGEGRLELADGTRYQGGFRAGQYQGEGALQRPDGSLLRGHWRAGQRVRDAAGTALPDPLELALLEQGRLLQEMLDTVPPSTPATELYALTLAGDGQQSVFLREVRYIDRLLRERFQARGLIGLVNHRDHLSEHPLATRESLGRAIRTLALRSGEEDLIFIYLTSHGSADHQLMLQQPRLDLQDLPAKDLAELLEPLAKRNKVVVVSACYSGGFIDALKDERTLVMTAARADRTSFGCSDDSDFTYFGRALFVQALQQTNDLGEAFELARQYVAEREQTDGFEASDPQIWAPEGVLRQWQQLIGGFARPLQDTFPSEEAH